MAVALSFTGTYPQDTEFWVPPTDAPEFPRRYGDLFTTPDLEACTDSKGKLWRAVMAVHPSCELGAKSAPTGVQVVRVHLLREVSAPQRDEIRAGFKETDGQFRIARTNMVYLAPPPEVDRLGEELVADLRASARVPLADLEDGRLAAMTHDARVAVLRRDIYFRYRWLLHLSTVAELEQARISADPAFEGPRPSWAPDPARTTGSP